MTLVWRVKVPRPRGPRAKTTQRLLPIQELLNNPLEGANCDRIRPRRIRSPTQTDGELVEYDQELATSSNTLCDGLFVPSAGWMAEAAFAREVAVAAGHIIDDPVGATRSYTSGDVI